MQFEYLRFDPVTCHVTFNTVIAFLKNPEVFISSPEVWERD